jgi:hypothetical protein
LLPSFDVATAKLAKRLVVVLKRTEDILDGLDGAGTRNLRVLSDEVVKHDVLLYGEAGSRLLLGLKLVAADILSTHFRTCVGRPYISSYRFQLRLF